MTAHDGASNSGSDIGDAAFEITDAVSDVDEGPVIEFGLRPVAPNPMRGVGRIAYAIPQESSVRIRIVDVRGRVVGTLVDGVRRYGRYAVSWDGTAAGRRLPAGAYFVEMQAGGKHLVQRLLIVR